VCTYANSSKVGALDVDELTLSEYGAVSRRAVLEMAVGVRALFGAQVSVAISGIAGPDGGTAEKPVGTTWTALISPRGEVAWVAQYGGDRLAVKEQATQAALEYLLTHLQAAAR
jgi:nicotinamide-nucleotide amidase